MNSFQKTFYYALIALILVSIALYAFDASITPYSKLNDDCSGELIILKSKLARKVEQLKELQDLVQKLEETHEQHMTAMRNETKVLTQQLSECADNTNDRIAMENVADVPPPVVQCPVCAECVECTKCHFMTPQEPPAKGVEGEQKQVAKTEEEKKRSAEGEGGEVTHLTAQEKIKEKEGDDQGDQQTPAEREEQAQLVQVEADAEGEGENVDENSELVNEAQNSDNQHNNIEAPSVDPSKHKPKAVAVNPSTKGVLGRQELPLSDITVIMAIISQDDLTPAAHSLGSILKEYSTLQIFVGCAVESCESVRTQINDLVSDKHQFNMSDFRTNKSLGAVWNALIHQVQTKYFLLIDPHTFFGRGSDLSYLFDGFALTNTTFVSGSLRNSKTSELYIPCYRYTWARWTLKVDYGYEYSLSHQVRVHRDNTDQVYSPCVACSATALPLAGLTSALRKGSVLGPFDEDLPMGTLADLFTRIEKKQLGLITCPSATFHTTHTKSVFAPHFLPDDKEAQTTALLPFAKKHQIDHIVQADSSHVWICSTEWTLALHHQYWMRGGLFTPACVYKKHRDFATEVLDLFRELKVPYYLKYGDALGAMKFGAFLPWDADWDLQVSMTSQTFNKTIVPHFETRGYQISYIKRDASWINIKPDKWKGFDTLSPGEKFKGHCDCSVLISVMTKPESQPHLSVVKLFDKYVPVLTNVFKFWKVRYGTAYFEHHFHHSQGGGRKFCRPVWSDAWYAYDGSRIVNDDKKQPRKDHQQIGHPGCLPDFRADGGGSFIDEFDYHLYG